MQRRVLGLAVDTRTIVKKKATILSEIFRITKAFAMVGNKVKNHLNVALLVIETLDEGSHGQRVSQALILERELSKVAEVTIFGELAVCSFQ